VTTEELDELFERSKDDRAIIVGSEVRCIIGDLRRERARAAALEAERDALREELGDEHDRLTAVRVECGDARALAARRGEALRLMLGFDTPWPLADVLLTLTTAVEHLMRDHDCDHQGWELVNGAIERGRKYRHHALTEGAEAAALSERAGPQPSKGGTL
jgi:hypothetical protein